MADDTRTSKEQLLDDLTQAVRDETRPNHGMSYAHQCAESDRRVARTRAARAALLAAMEQPSHEPRTVPMVELQKVRDALDEALGPDYFHTVAGLIEELSEDARTAQPPRASDDAVAVLQSLLDQCRPYVVKADREGPNAHPRVLMNQIDAAIAALTKGGEHG